LAGTYEKRCVLGCFDPPKVEKIALKVVKLQLVAPKTSNTILSRVEDGSSIILRPKRFDYGKKIEFLSTCNVSLHPQVPFSHEIFFKVVSDPPDHVMG
jgi:hypothetical protein